MRHLIVALSLLLYAATAQAGVFIGFGQQSGPTLLDSEDFEGAGVPEGWTPTTGTYAGDYDYNGGGSLLLVEPQYAQTPAVTISGATYSIRYRANFLSLNHGYSILRIYNGASEIGRILYLNNGVIQAAAGGGTQALSAQGVIATGESWIRADYTQGTGLNATLEVFTSANGISWTSRVKSDDGTSLAKADRARLRGMVTGTVIDDVTQMEP